MEFKEVGFLGCLYVICVCAHTHTRVNMYSFSNEGIQQKKNKNADFNT